MVAPQVGTSAGESLAHPGLPLDDRLWRGLFEGGKVISDSGTQVHHWGRAERLSGVNVVAVPAAAARAWSRSSVSTWITRV